MLRTTLTLDEDVVRRLRREMQRTGRSFKETVNDALRNGLDGARSADRPRIELPTFPLRARPGVEFDDIGALLEQAEGLEHP